jgi:GxxExxY protein
MESNKLSYIVIGCAFKVHSKLGPGLLESTYEACLVHELVKSNLRVEQQKQLPVFYDNIQLDLGYRIDLLVDDRLIIEIKSVNELAPIHAAQLLSYLRLSELRLGLLINFNVVNLRHGIKRIIL